MDAFAFKEPQSNASVLVVAAAEVVLLCASFIRESSAANQDFRALRGHFVLKAYLQGMAKSILLSSATSPFRRLAGL